MKRALPLILLLGCDPFGHWPDGSLSVEGPLWDRNVVPSADGGLYVTLPAAHQLVHAAPGKDETEVTPIDLDGAEPVRLVASPDASRLLAFSRWPMCTAESNKKIDLVEDCPSDELTYGYELALVSGTERYAVADVPGHMNALAFSPDNATAVAYLEYDQDVDLPADLVVDLYEVEFVDLDDGTTQSVNVGFSPSNILFSPATNRAVVLSRSQATVIDLTDFSVDVTYPLTLDADQVVDPVGAELTPDGRYAIISIEGSADLYTLDLEVEHVDIKELVAPPSAMWVSPTTEFDFTVLGYNAENRLDVYDHTYFNYETVVLEEPVNHIVGDDGMVVAYHDVQNTHDVYRLDLGTLELTEYVVANPVASLEVLEVGGVSAYAVAVLEPEGGSGSDLDQYQDANWGLAVMDLSDDDIVNLVVGAQPVGLALAERDGRAYALVLVEGVETLLMIDLSAPSAAQEIELGAPPVAIGEMPDGSFYITHDSALGLVTILDPTNPESMTEVSGFATLGLFDDYELPRTEDKK